MYFYSLLFKCLVSNNLLLFEHSLQSYIYNLNMIYLLPDDDLQLESKEKIKRGNKVSLITFRQNNKSKSTPSKKISERPREQSSFYPKENPYKEELSSNHCTR